VAPEATDKTMHDLEDLLVQILIPGPAQVDVGSP
jgi:hypothetical protein